jgi:hypothetical protein
MKSLLFSLPLAIACLILGGCSTLPPWRPVPMGQSSVYGKVENPNALMSFLAFSDAPGIMAISVQYTFGGNAPGYAVLVDWYNRPTIRNALAKFEDWERLAQENKVDITKEIATVRLLQMTQDGKEWSAEGRRDLTFLFSSRIAADGTQTVSLIVRSSSFWGGSDQIALTGDEAQDFATLMQDNAIAQGFGQAEKKQHAIGLFN